MDTKIKIEIEKQVVGEPAIAIFKVVMTKKENGVWEETFGTRDLTAAFLRGVQAALSFTEVGFFSTPPIPSDSII